METAAQISEHNLPLEFELALVKAEKRDARAVKNAGYGDSDLALVITKGYIGTVADLVRSKLTEHQHPNTNIEAALRIVGNLCPEVLALCGLSSCLHGVALGQTSTAIASALGRNVAAECWTAGLTKHDPKAAAAIEKAARAANSNVEYRRQAARSFARRTNYKFKRWSNADCIVVGNWLMGCVIECLPDIFEWVGGDSKQPYILSICEGAEARASEAVGESIIRNPVYLPVTNAPARWTRWTMAHPNPKIIYNTTFIRTHYKDVAAACKSAIDDGSMMPALDGVSTLQGVPWRINQRVLGVFNACVTNGIDVPGLPAATDIPLPPLDKPWDKMIDLERTLWKIEATEARAENRALRGDRIMLTEDLQIATVMAEADRFWTPMNCDWRGRVYATCHFNFQREDRVRALFQFADGEPIGEDGLYWLKVHVANCGDFDKISKRPLAERVQWVDDNFFAISSFTELPLKELGWMEADKPFLFLASCFELVEAIRAGAEYITRLPVSFDGSCSGLQHLSAMTRDENTAALVNLTPSETPQDVYQVVATLVSQRVRDDASGGDASDIANKFLAFGIDRKLCKRNVMTYSYSSKKFGMASQQQVDLMDVLQKDVLRRKYTEHPFYPSHKGSIDRPGKAARYIAGHVFTAIEERIHRPAQAMKFLQGLAKTLAHEGKPVRWTTPTGIPWVNRYHDVIEARLRLWLHDRGVKFPTQSRVIIDHKKEIDKDRAANGVAPNFVHACDAAHLLLTANAAASEGITNIATVHDSFGCLASRARRFNEIIREQFVRMYETHDVLTEVYEQSKCDLTQHHWDRMPSVPQYGTLNLKEISNATFAFA